MWWLKMATCAALVGLGAYVVLRLLWARITRDHPELGMLEDKAQQRKVLQRARPRPAPHILIVIVTMAGATGIVRAVAAPHLRIPVEILDATAMGVVLTLVLVVEYAVQRKRFTRRIRAQLRELGLPICVSCGYDLRGTTEQRCPECGTPVGSTGESTSVD